MSQTDYDGKTTTSDVISVFIEAPLQVNIHPNPINDQLIIDFPTVLTTSKYQISLLNEVGQQLLFLTSKNAKLTIPVEDLSSGIYFVNIIGENNTTTKKIVKL